MRLSFKGYKVCSGISGISQLLNSYWREPIHTSATLLSGEEGDWREVVAKLDSEISLSSGVQPEFPFFGMRIWQKAHNGLVLAVLRDSGKREVWLLHFWCVLKSSEQNERSMRVKAEIQIQNRLSEIRSKSRSMSRERGNAKRVED